MPTRVAFSLDSIVCVCVRVRACSPAFKMHSRLLCVYAEHLGFCTHFEQHSSAVKPVYFVITQLAQGSQHSNAEGHVPAVLPAGGRYRCSPNNDVGDANPNPTMLGISRANMILFFPVLNWSANGRARRS